MNNFSQICHVLIFEDNSGIRSISLKEKAYSLGRNKSNHIVFLTSKAVSRNHAMLFRTQNNQGEYSYQIVDGDVNGKRSTNGLVVNGERCHSHNLAHGDVITLGSVKVFYQVLPLNLNDHQIWQVNSKDILIDPSQSLSPKATLVNADFDSESSLKNPQMHDDEDIPETLFFRTPR